MTEDVILEPGTWDGYLRNETYQVTMANQLAIEDAITRVTSHGDWVGGRVKYLNLPMSFDIETTNFRDEEDNKCAIMYIWQTGINGAFFYGRTWNEFIMFTDILANQLATSSNRRAILYVFNLSFEFQFMRRYFDNQIVNLFAEKDRKPIYFVLSNGLEFRDAQILAGSNYSLDYVGRKLLHTYPIRKLTGGLDYDLIRHSKTPLTDKEMQYCINDVLVLNSFIQEKIESDGDISYIPLTNTGYVRNYTRHQVTGNSYKEDKEYHAIMKSLRILTLQEYLQSKRVLQGGFTHASALHSTDTLPDLASEDIKSSYPAEIVLDYLPMSPFKEVDVNDDETFRYYINTKCCMFDVEFYNIRANSLAALPISSSKAKTKGEQIFQGRIVKADSLIISCTELDFQTYEDFYDWDGLCLTNFRIAERGHLPTSFISAVLDLFKAKTELDGVPEAALEYMTSKNMLNSEYGMMVTAIIRAEIIYANGDWDKSPIDFEQQLLDYNENYNRFLSYAWGIWVTAHARRNLFKAIKALGDDFVYCDTDSVKFLHEEHHKDFFDSYNKNIYNKILIRSLETGIPISSFIPTAPNGVKKMIGKFEYELTYRRFKTLGPKRYMYELNKIEPDFIKDADGNEIPNPAAGKYVMGLTNGGVNTKKALAYMRRMTNYDNSKTFDMYTNGLFIPASDTGKLTHTYIDETRTGILTDYLGNTATYSQRSGLHLEPQSYSADIHDDYVRFLRGIGHEEI